MTAQPGMRWYEHIGLNIYWLGIHTATGTLTPILLPYLVMQFMPPEQKNTYLAVLRTFGLAVAMLVQPIFGMLSDASTSRWGRRRPFIAASAVGSMIFLTLIGVTPLFLGSRLDAFFRPALGITTAYAGLVLGVILWQVTSNIGQGALQGLIPDLVPEHQRGRSSGVKSVLELLPALLVIFIGPLVDRGQVRLVTAIIAAGLLVTMLVTLFAAREKPQRAKPEPGRAEAVWRIVALTAVFVAVTQAAVWLVRASGWALAGQGFSTAAQIGLVGLAGLAGMAGSIFLGVYLGARVGIGREAGQHKSFIWWVINRLLFLSAVGSIQGFAQYFIRDVLRVPNPASTTTLLLGVVALFLLPSAVISGQLSDKIGRQRLVSCAGLIAAVGTLALLFARSIPLVIFSGAIIGTGAGMFMAVSWALGTDLAPRQSAGRYLGISNLAGAGAGIVGAGIGGPMADFFNAAEPGLGYPVIFALYCGLFLISVWTIRKIQANDQTSSPGI